MLERFTDQARRAVVLAEEEARMLDHNWIGTEHLLLGLIREGDGVAARALESLGISLQPVRQEVEEITGRGQQVPSEQIPFTPRSKKVLELSLRESLQLGQDHVGTEHILLGLIREGDGVAAQVLVRLGADLNRVRQQVIELVSDPRPQSGRRPPREVVPVIWMQVRLDVVEGRLAAVEQRVGIGPDTSDLDEQVNRIRDERHAAATAQSEKRASQKDGKRAYRGCEGSPAPRPFNTSRVAALRLAFDRAAAVARVRTSPTPERPAQAPHAAGAEPRREAGRVQPIGAPATLTGGSARCAEPQSVTSMSAE